MQYRVIVKQAQYLIWEDVSNGELLYTGIIGDHAWAPRTFVMNGEEIEKFKTQGEKYLEDLRMELEGEFKSEFWVLRFIKDFDKDPEISAIIFDRSYSIPPEKKAGFFSRLFGSH